MYLSLQPRDLEAVVNLGTGMCSRIRRTQRTTRGRSIGDELTLIQKLPGCQVLKYLLNVGTFNELTMKWQVVARALMSRMMTSAYRTAFDKTNLYENR